LITIIRSLIIIEDDRDEKEVGEGCV
jgi:hypothetical protein